MKRVVSGITRLEKALAAFVEEFRMSYSALTARIEALGTQAQQIVSTQQSAILVLEGLRDESRAAHAEATAALEQARNGDPTRLQAAVDQLGAFGDALDQSTVRLAEAITSPPQPAPRPQAGSLATPAPAEEAPSDAPPAGTSPEADTAQPPSQPVPEQPAPSPAPADPADPAASAPAGEAPPAPAVPDPSPPPQG